MGGIQDENSRFGNLLRDGRASSSQAEVADSCNRASLPASERRTNDDERGVGVGRNRMITR